MPKKFKLPKHLQSVNARDKQTDKYYRSKHWIQIREYRLRNNPFCEECERQGRLTPGNTVDHIIPRNQGGEDEIDNLQTLCPSCHARKSAKERNDRYKP